MNMQDINDILYTHQENLVIIKIYGDECPACNVLKPILSKLCSEYNIKLYQYSIDELDFEVSEQLNIFSIPLVLFCKNNEIKETIIGAYPEFKLREIISKYK